MCINRLKPKQNKPKPNQPNQQKNAPTKILFSIAFHILNSFLLHLPNRAPLKQKILVVLMTPIVWYILSKPVL